MIKFWLLTLLYYAQHIKPDSLYREITFQLKIIQSNYLKIVLNLHPDTTDAFFFKTSHM